MLFFLLVSLHHINAMQPENMHLGQILQIVYTTLTTTLCHQRLALLFEGKLIFFLPKNFIYCRVITFGRTFQWKAVEANAQVKYGSGVQAGQFNGYPLKIVVRQNVKRRSANPTTADTSDDDQSSQHSIPHIKGVSEGTARILGRHGIRVGHKPCGTLRQLLM